MLEPLLNPELEKEKGEEEADGNGAVQKTIPFTLDKMMSLTKDEFPDYDV
jgi:hypothetical protein